jgi:putative membrane protein
MSEFLVLLGACAAGSLMGVMTGLTPGIHVNTLLPFMVVLPVSGTVGASLIFSLAVAHTFLDFIPSTIFGVPDGDTALSVLPAHRLLLSGRGYEAIKLTVVGSLGALIVSCMLVLPMIYCIPILYRTISPYMEYVLLSFVFFIILSEKCLKKMLLASTIFLIAGLYGYTVLSTPLGSENLILFPVFCGLFGLSTLLVSLKMQSELPLQPLDSRIHLNRREIFVNIAKGAAAGIFVSLFPGIGPAHATAVISVRTSPRQFLVAVSGVNTANAVYALVGLYTIGKARSGAVVAIQNLIQPEWKPMVVLLSCGLVAAGIASVTALYVARIILRVVSHIDYKKLMGGTCLILVMTVWIVTGASGLLVLAVGCCIGILPLFLGIRRSHCMGVLLLPILIYYLGLSL